MVLQEFSIYFNNVEATYAPGETVSGKVILAITDTPNTIRGIKLSIKGISKTQWTSGKTQLTGCQKHFNQELFVLGREFGEALSLNPGIYSYPFSYILSSNLPSSFQSSYGYVRYSVKASLYQPSWPFHQSTREVFTVAAQLDLNALPYASKSMMLEKSRTFGGCCTGSPPLTVNIRIPAQGYCPGQIIPVKVDVENLSGVGIHQVSFSLKKIVTYTANFTTGCEEKTKKRKVVFECLAGPIRGHETTSYEQHLPVPPLSSSSLERHIIFVDYKLNVKFGFNGWHSDLKMRFPIVIGTQPLLNYQYPELTNQSNRFIVGCERNTEGIS